MNAARAARGIIFTCLFTAFHRHARKQQRGKRDVTACRKILSCESIRVYFTVALLKSPDSSLHLERLVLQSQNLWRRQRGLRVRCWHCSRHRSFLSALLRREKRRGGQSEFLTEPPPLLPRRVQPRLRFCQLGVRRFSLIRPAGKRGRAFRLLFAEGM